MKQLKLPVSDTNGYYSIMEMGDYEYAHPLEKIGEEFISFHMTMNMDYLLFAKKNNKLPTDARVRNPLVNLENVARNATLKKWTEEMLDLNSQVLPDNFMGILNGSKSEQKKILKNVVLKSKELKAFFARGGEHGYSLSSYRIEQVPEGFNFTDMPLFAYKKDDGVITAIGKTPLTKGQIKHVIDHRSVRVAKFLDNGNKWHCFFLTYKSISGQETYRDGAHIHFISHTWTYSREHALEQLRNPKYHLAPLHVAYRTHRDKS